MIIIEIQALPNGAHRNQTATSAVIPAGWAIIPEDMPVPKTFPFVDLTAEGQRQWRELLGLKRYLLDFSLLAERTVSETVLWQEYMVYAALLGIAEQVLEQVRTLYPQQLSQVERYQRYLHGTNQYNHYLYAAVARQRQAAQAARSGGSGGFASLGGGGGFSGGGSVGTR